MDTLRVDIAYRPLRIGWAIHSGDFEALRRAIRISFALWGGIYNPIIVVGEKEYAKNLVNLFRLDFIMAIGNSEDVQAFSKSFPYLIKPFFYDDVFFAGGGGSRVLDIHNALAYLHRQPEWEGVQEDGVRLYTWSSDDPLADLFLMQLGDYPPANETHINYRDFLVKAGDATEVHIDPTIPLPTDIFEHPSIPFISRCGIQRHHSVRAGWDWPGFYFGRVNNFNDLVCFWNLRAADIRLQFLILRIATSADRQLFLGANPCET